MLALEKESIESRPIWKPMHLQPVFENCNFVTANCISSSISADIFNRGICLPSDIKNTKEDMDRIIGIILKLFGK
jgi:dTDP-4-amino-4,6-dideoxygalactose transaminase